MFVVGVTAYGLATFEGPMLSLKSVNALSHFTDWTIAHVHIGTLGWNGKDDFEGYKIPENLFHVNHYTTVQTEMANPR